MRTRSSIHVFKSLALCIMLMLACATSLSAQNNAEILESANAKVAEAERELEATRTQLAATRAENLRALKQAYTELALEEQALLAAQAAMSNAEKRHEESAQALRSLEEEVSAQIKSIARTLDLELPPGDAQSLLRELPRIVEAKLAQDHAALSETLASSLVTREVLDRKGQRIAVPLLTLSPEQAYALGDSPESFGPLAALHNGDWQIVGPALLAPEAINDITWIPFAPAGAPEAALPEEGFSIAAWLAAGGFFVWPILIAGLLGLVLCIERFATLSRLKPSAKQVADAEALVAQSQWEQLANDERPSSPLARVARVGARLASQRATREQVESSLDAALSAESASFERSFMLIAALAAVAPLLGLLGTVTGMIATFDVLANEGAGDPQKLSGGISVALTTTQLGLLVAIPLLLLHAWLKRISDRSLSQLEHIAMLFLSPAKEEAQAPSESGGEA